MYSKYAVLQDWKQKTLDSHLTELGGIKQITSEVKGKDVFSKIKYEAGVHRVQRIPETGQNVNKRDTAVRITHIPTGLVVTSQTERSQLQNKENALAILSAKLLKEKEERETSKLGGERKAQIGWAMRAEKIRTYNFPQDRITDHRIKKKWHNIEDIMNGKLDKMLKTLSKNLSKT